MRYLEAKTEADKINGVVYKTRFNNFEVTKDFHSLALKVIQQYLLLRGSPEDVCMYEVISDKQCTYSDLDLKHTDCLSIPQKLRDNKCHMAAQFLELLK